MNIVLMITIVISFCIVVMFASYPVAKLSNARLSGAETASKRL